MGILCKIGAHRWASVNHREQVKGYVSDGRPATEPVIDYECLDCGARKSIALGYTRV